MSASAVVTEPMIYGPVEFDWDVKNGAITTSAKTTGKYLQEWARDTTEQKIIILFGENTLTFSAALCSLLNVDGAFSRTPLVLPTVYESPDVSDSLVSPETLAQLGVFRSQSRSFLDISMGVLHGVNATEIHLSHSPLHAVFPTVKVSYFMWNFPFTGEDDNIDAQKNLILGFFFSASRLIMRKKIEDVANVPKILLTLCNDQAQRWDVESLARSQMLVITKSWPFDISEFRRYQPTRNSSVDFFPVEFPVTYEFSYSNR